MATLFGAPWLLLSNGDEISEQSFYDVNKNDDLQLIHTTTTSIPDLCGKYIFTCAYGWLVLYDDKLQGGTNCCLWNPTSMETIQLPYLENVSIYDRCVLSKSPTDPDCYILFVCHCGLQEAFCRIGDDEFILQSVEGDFLLALVVFEGKIYGMTEFFQFVVVDFVDGELELFTMSNVFLHQPGSQPWLIDTRNYLIECPCRREFLLVQQIEYGMIDFRIFQIDIDEMELQEIQSLGDRVIFLPHRRTGGVCRYPSNIEIKPNSIYYIMPKSMNLYLFDLDDKSTTLLSPWPCPAKSESFEWFWVDRQLFKNFV